MTCSTSFGLVQRWMYGKKFDSIPFCFKISLLCIFPFYWITELPVGEIPYRARKVFTNSKKIIRLMQHIKKRASCTAIFQNLKVLLPTSKYLRHSFTADNMDTFRKLRHTHDHHFTSVNFSSYQKGVYYAGTKLYNSLPPNNKIVNRIDIYKPELKACTLTHCFYSVEFFCQLTVRNQYTNNQL